MHYFKSLFFNILAVFFANYLIPGISFSPTKLPEVRGDLIFAAGVGFLQSLVFPLLKLWINPPFFFKIGVATFIISIASYSLVNFFPLGIHLSFSGAFIWAVVSVWCISFLINFLEYKHWGKAQKNLPPSSKEPSEEE